MKRSRPTTTRTEPTGYVVAIVALALFLLAVTVLVVVSL